MIDSVAHIERALYGVETQRSHICINIRNTEETTTEQVNNFEQNMEGLFDKTVAIIANVEYTVARGRERIS